MAGLAEGENIQGNQGQQSAARSGQKRANAWPESQGDPGHASTKAKIVMGYKTREAQIGGPAWLSQNRAGKKGTAWPCPDFLLHQECG